MSTFEPRGLRINNPLNIRREPGQVWVGQTVDQPDPGFVSFISPEYGYRAAAHIIMRHYIGGKTTVAGVISHWAPPTENDTRAYIAKVEERLAMSPGAALSLPAQMPQLLHAMTVQEQGECPYSDEIIVAGINLDGVRTMPDINPPAPPPITAKTMALGAVKSKTINFAVILAALSNLQEAFPTIAPLLHTSPEFIQIAGSALAFVIAILRYLTKQSLAQKATSTH